MEDFVALFCRKYQWPVQMVMMLMEKMERVIYTRGECLVREGELNTDFHLIAEGIWRGLICAMESTFPYGLLLGGKRCFLHGDT